MLQEARGALRNHLQRFGREGKIFAAPARGNLIGEHTDYTGGLVMPMAIGFRTVAVVSRRTDGKAVEEIRKVVDVWAEQYVELGGRDDIGYVHVFENRESMIGASNPHPHGQIWASRSVPNEVVAELGGQKAYFLEKNEVLLCEYLALEVTLGEHVVAANAGFVALVPYWAVWPFEVMILPRRNVSQVQETTDAERSEFAAILQTMTATYDRVFDTPFPYSMGLHPAPCDG